MKVMESGIFSELEISKIDPAVVVVVVGRCVSALFRWSRKLPRHDFKATAISSFSC
jgi:hypothetical protein